MKEKINIKNKKVLIIAFFIIIMILLTGTVFAYFTAYLNLQYEYTNINLQSNEFELVKQKENNNTHITIINKNKIPCFVRIKIFAASENLFEITSSNNWNYNENDGYWYYEKALNESESTQSLTIQTNSKNIVVVGEATYSKYDKNNGLYAEWEKVYNH